MNKSALLAATLVAGSFWGFGAGATTITFDGAGYPDHSAGGSATVDGYYIAPTNINSGNCASGDCTTESPGPDGGGTALPSITRVLPPMLFTAESFWFSLQGKGNEEGYVDGVLTNYLEVSAFDAADTLIKSYVFYIGMALDAYSLDGLGIAYTGGEGSTDGDPKSCDRDTTICKQLGYTVTLNSFFEDIAMLSFTPHASANARIDTIELSTVPVPAAGVLLIGGLGVLGAMRMRRKSA